ncbi:MULTISPECIES: LysR substrate-binding domain-containing protein [Ramlibacter]|uniref:LysR substrate-binding domain-containing protein n=1 Tax=Ramlibacter TaxID=174951 RepID=UPI0015EF8536|nr:LysR family transcriptional regulator [Ramlibacter sp. CGMCC 1.13660]
MNNRINLKLLATFLAVAENASFRKAADQLHLSLPAVSMQVKQLEEQLGVALFQRTTRRVDLTREGEQLLISARKAMAELDGGLARIQQAAHVLHGHLAFACVPTVAATRLPPILTRFAAQYPGITLHVRELTHAGLLEAVRRREVDFGIGPVPERPGELDFAPLFEDEYRALLPRSYRDRGRTGISLRELARLPLLTLSDATLFRGHLDDALRGQGLVVQSNYEFTSVATLVAMAEAGLGVAMLPAVAVPRRTPLKAVRILAPVLSRTIAVVTIRGFSLSPAAQRLVDLCGELMAEPAA